jgi:scyllo-inositol 2-dehydrogenase (NADP+)
VRAEAYGPVVLRPKGATWRAAKNEGGGALYDYACHAIDLVNFIAGVPASVGGAVRNGVFSRDVEDEVYSSFYYPGGASGQLCVNWSDESFRKMSTKISIWGTNGRLTADRQECQIYLREPVAALPDAGKGWTVRYTTDLSEPVWFYLRGEEYSAQIDYFVKSIQTGRTDGENTFRSALAADRVVEMILADGGSDGSAAPVGGVAARQPAPKGLLARLFG